MFQLIVAVISIALVAALAIASIFYGGDAFTKSSEKANVTTLVNQGQQISGAAQLYKTDRAVLPANVDVLVTDKYLSVKPSAGKITSGDWTISTNTTGQKFAVIAFAAGVGADALCAAGKAAAGETPAVPAGEVIAQNGKCTTAAGGTGNTHFGFPL